MRGKFVLRAGGAILAVCCLVAVAAADVKLPGVFGDHMVLQRKRPAWADPWTTGGDGQAGRGMQSADGRQSQNGGGPARRKRSAVTRPRHLAKLDGPAAARRDILGCAETSKKPFRG